MKKIPNKNYIILIVLLAVTVLLTLFIADIYTSKNKLTSNFYEISNKITPTEFNQYMSEHSDVIIYISDKYDLTYESFEKEFESKLGELNLKENLVYIDKEQIDDEFLVELKNTYRINIDIERTPIIVVIVDNTVVKNIYVDSNSNVDIFIDYKVFE